MGKKVIKKGHARAGSINKNRNKKKADSLIPSESSKSLTDFKTLTKKESVSKLPVTIDSRTFISSQFITQREEQNKEANPGKEILSSIFKQEEKSFKDFKNPQI